MSRFSRWFQPEPRFVRELAESSESIEQHLERGLIDQRTADEARQQRDVAEARAELREENNRYWREEGRGLSAEREDRELLAFIQAQPTIEDVARDRPGLLGDAARAWVEHRDQHGTPEFFGYDPPELEDEERE